MVPGMNGGRRLDDYLCLGFAPDWERAQAYLRGLLAHDTAPEAPGTALCRVMEEHCHARRAPRPVLLLSGGLDSRLLLGAFLATRPRTDLLGLTFGTEDLPDVRIARRTCRRLGVEHRVLDPNTVVWDLDEIAARAVALNRKTGALPPVDALVMYEELRRAAGAGATVISGYLGDALSGKHLPEAPVKTETEAAAAFRRANRAFRTAANPSGVDRRLVAFLRSSSGLLEGWPGACLYDLLDIGLRQALRIRAVTGDAFEDCVRPYEDRRWVACWLRREGVRDREQRAYRAFCREAFPKTFALPPPERRAPRRGWQRLIPAFLRAPQPILNRENRGDPARNASLRSVYAALLADLDRRGVLGEPALPLLETALRNPDRRAFRRLRWAASAALYLRVGLIAAE